MTMKFLAIEKEMKGVSPKDFQPYLKAEAKRALELYQEGIVRELYFREDETSAVLVLECLNMDEAKKVLNSLPLVREGLISFEIIPLIPYPGFSRLFEDTTK